MKTPYFHHRSIRRDHPDRSQTGFGLVELIIAFAIMVTISMVLINHITVSYRGGKLNKDKVFATTKANAILEELQAYVSQSEDITVDNLDQFDDGVTPNPILTISKEGGNPVAADHPLSGNFQKNGNWVWTRQVSVRPVAGLNNRNIRYVTVRVFKRSSATQNLLVAEISRVVNSVATYFPPTQEYDIYLIGIENIPGWWVYMEAIRPFVEASITDLESRNPGAKFRTHWITKAAYGRDQLYTPWINLANDSNAAIPTPYFYPGLMPTGSASTYYYVPDLMRARMNEDGTVINGYDATKNPLPYALADQYNHAMRYPDEKALFDARVAAGLENPDEPTYRLFLEDLATNPDKYRNAIIMNMHGEFLPVPALRNYSDAAKSPTADPGLRVVTHPEHLRYVRGATASASEDVYLRVYAWRTNPTAPADKWTDNKSIALQIMNANLTGNINGSGVGTQTLQIQYLEGGVDRGDGDDSYKAFANAPTVTALSKGMYYKATYVDDTGSGGEKYTLIQLYNTPSIAPRLASNKGVDPTRRLYGYEYIPCPVESALDFSNNLNSTVKNPNTARWRIRIPKEVLGLSGTGLSVTDNVLAIRTRIGDNLTTGQAYPVAIDPANLSTTYTWWVDSLEDVPYTERSQFIGDPRHMPYADCFNGGSSFPNAYNPYHDDLNNGTNVQAEWPALDASRLQDGWKGKTEIDYSRYAQLIRESLSRSGSLWCTLTGWSYYYVGIGGEIGYDSANNYPNSISVNGAPYGMGSTLNVNNMASAGGSTGEYVKYVREGGGSSWWSQAWLGELYPDKAYATWVTTGTIPSGSASNRFYRTKRANITANMPLGTSFNNTRRRTQREGCTSIFNIGTSSPHSTFHHQGSSGNSTIGGAGLELQNNYNFVLPSAIPTNRPFGIDLSSSGGFGSEYGRAEFPRFTGSIVKSYYTKSSSTYGSALVGLTSPSNKTAFIVVNGLSQTIQLGSSFIGKYSVLALLHSYFETGNPSVTNHHELPPRILITSPTEITDIQNPTSIPIQWSTQWKRWDGQKYSGSFSASYAGNESTLEYVVMYSKDGGKNFVYVQDGTPATPGVRPTSSSYRIADFGVGDETYNWPTPAIGFPEGSYVIRIEAYRVGSNLHYSYHQTKIYIHR